MVEERDTQQRNGESPILLTAQDQELTANATRARIDNNQKATVITIFAINLP